MAQRNLALGHVASLGAGVHRVRVQRTAPRQIRSALGAVLHDILPPVERAYELSELTLTERMDLFRMCGLTTRQQRLYESALRRWRAAA
jgi:hypothetical protein